LENDNFQKITIYQPALFYNQLFFKKILVSLAIFESFEKKFARPKESSNKKKK